MSQAIRLRRRLEPWFAGLPSEPIRSLTIVLRIDGSLGSFGPPGIENLRLGAGAIECDLVIEDLGWKQVQEAQLATLLSERVTHAIAHCLEQAEVAYDAQELRELLE